MKTTISVHSDTLGNIFSTPPLFDGKIFLTRAGLDRIKDGYLSHHHSLRTQTERVEIRRDALAPDCLEEVNFIA